MCFNHVWFKLDFWKPFRSNPEQYQWLQTVQDAVLDLHFYQSVWCIGSCMNIFVSWSSAGTKCGPLKKKPIKDDLTVATKIWSHRLQNLLVLVCVSSCEQWTPSTKWIHSPLLFVDVAWLFGCEHLVLVMTESTENTPLCCWLISFCISWRF